MVILDSLGLLDSRSCAVLIFKKLISLLFPFSFTPPGGKTLFDNFVHALNDIGLQDTEEDADPDKIDLEIWDKEMVNISFENKGLKVIEEEIGNAT